MHQRFRIVVGLLVVCALFWAPSGASAQGVTTGSIAGIVKDAQGLAVPGSTVLAVHQPSGSTYEAVTREDGRFAIPGMRVGGPYTVTASLEGFQPSVTSDVYVNLGVAADLTLTLKTLAMAEEVTVVAQSDAVFSSARTGASTAISRETLASLPTLGNRLQDFTRLTPQAAGTSFGGVDNRLNNITVDGSYFNNSFGLGGSPGDRTGVAPISLSAIEAVQVNIAPYDVRQGNFVGAGVNTVTRSGGNAFRGSAFYQWKNDGLVGTEAKGLAYNPGTFDFHNLGGWVSGPVVKNKLFFFFNFEDEANTYPGTTYKANNGGETVAGNTTRVLASDLQALSSFMKSKFNYDTGPYQDYQFETPARRYLFRADYNLNSTNKVSFRYNQLDSNTDVLLSNSSSLGWGTRRSNTDGPELRVVELPDQGRHPLVHRRVERGLRREQGQHPDRGLYEAGRKPRRPVSDAVPDDRHPRGQFGVHHARVRAVHAEQRAALQHVPAAGQLLDLPEGPLADLRRELRELPSPRTCSSPASRAPTSTTRSPTSTPT